MLKMSTQFHCFNFHAVFKIVFQRETEHLSGNRETWIWISSWIWVKHFELWSSFSNLFFLFSDKYLRWMWASWLLFAKLNSIFNMRLNTRKAKNLIFEKLSHREWCRTWVLNLFSVYENFVKQVIFSAGNGG